MPSKKPIVFFRSFGMDQVKIYGTGISFLSKRKLTFKNYEELLKSAVGKLGPFVAIGKPGDKVPPLGAARMYVDDDNWQDTVKKLTKKAKLVLLHLSESEGVLWESKFIAKNLQPEKLILCLPLTFRGEKIDKEIYQTFRKKFLSIFPHPLPENVGDAQFIFFSKNWTPHLLVPHKSKLSLHITNDDKNEAKKIQALALEGLNRKFALAKTPLFFRHPIFWLCFILIVFFLALFIGR
jgi:hypothetical protein